MPATLVCEKSELLDPAPSSRVPWNRQRTGRSAVLWGVFAFVLSQVALRVVIDGRRPDLRDPIFENKYRQLKKRLADGSPTAAPVIFFGSSMTAHAVNAGMLEAPLSRALNRPVAAFNMGTNSAGPLTHLLFLRRLLERGIRPNLAVIELTPLVHDCTTEPADVNQFPAQVLSRRDMEVVQRFSRDPELWPEWWQSLLVPAYGHRLTVLHEFGYFLVPFPDRMEINEDMDANGWRKVEVPETSLHLRALERVKELRGPRLSRFSPGKPAFQALTELMELLKRENIPAILVVMPEGPVIRSLYDPSPVAKLLGDFVALGQSYHLPLIDGREWCGEVLFSDSHHLTKVGAQVFTERLGREMARLLSARR